MRDTIKNFRNKSTKIKLLYLLVFVVIFVVLFVLSTVSNEVRNSINYNETLLRDYEIKLLPNDEYGEIIVGSDDNNTYSSNIFDKIIPEFNYTLNASSHIKMKYKYDVTYSFLITDKNGEVLEENTENIETKEEEVNEEFYAINKKYDIDYQQYIDDLESYRPKYNDEIDGYLVISFDLSMKASENNFTKALNKTATQQIMIPLGKDNKSIQFKTDNVNVSKNIKDKVLFRVKNIVLFILCIIFLLLSSFVLIIIVIDKSHNRIA